MPTRLRVVLCYRYHPSSFTVDMASTIAEIISIHSTISSLSLHCPIIIDVASSAGHLPPVLLPSLSLSFFLLAIGQFICVHLATQQTQSRQAVSSEATASVKLPTHPVVYCELRTVALCVVAGFLSLCMALCGWAFLQNFHFETWCRRLLHCWLAVASIP